MENQIGNGGLQCYSRKNRGRTLVFVGERLLLDLKRRPTNAHRRSSSLAIIQRPQIHRRLTKHLAGHER